MPTTNQDPRIGGTTQPGLLKSRKAEEDYLPADRTINRWWAVVKD
jgi:hypothetical protein